jgi:hypothetical protein
MSDGRVLALSTRPGKKFHYVYEHVLIAETALGKPLPKGSPVHHVDGDHSHNQNNNLVICQDQSYHMLLHTRTRALLRGGNPNTDKVCSRCDKAKPTGDFPRKESNWDGLYAYCRQCVSEIGKVYWKNKNATLQEGSQQCQ